jgi:hypothetical protein
MSGLKLALYGTALFRYPRTQNVTTKLNYPFLFFKPLHRNRTSFTTTAAAATTSTAVETVSSVDHPWPEWISFVDRLTSKGYLSKSDDSVYSNINLLKDASLSFARDRYDVFKFVFFPFLISIILFHLDFITNSFIRNLGYLLFSINFMKELTMITVVDDVIM